MPIHLPDLGETHCKSVIACGKVETKSKTALKVLHGTNNRLLIEYERRGQTFCAFVLFGGGYIEGPTNHFHVEVTRKAEGEVVDPKWSACSEDEIQQYFKVLIGKSIDVRVTGSFETESRRISPLSWAYDVVSMRKRMKRSSNRIVDKIVYRVKSPFTTRLTISFSEDGKKFETELYTFARGLIRENYLDSLLMHLEMDYCLGILGEVPNVIREQD
jgi:hypothetical protein